MFTISFSNPTKSVLNIQIFNVLGLEITNVLHKVEDENTMIDASTLLNGHYVVKIEGIGIHQVVSMLVNH